MMLLNAVEELKQPRKHPKVEKVEAMKVKAIRTKRQEFADSVRMYQEYTQKLEQVRGSYQKN